MTSPPPQPGVLFHLPPDGAEQMPTGEGVRLEGYEGHPRWVLPVDCMSDEGLPSLGENTVSLILADPPYFIDGMGDEWDNAKLRRRTEAWTDVVGGIPAVQRFNPEQGVRLQAFLEPVAAEMMRVLKPGGFALCFSQARLSHRTAMAFENAGFEIRDLLAWTYEGQAKAFTQDHFVRKMDLPDAEQERIIGLLGGRKTPQVKPQMEPIVLAQKSREGTFVDNWLEHEAGLIDVRSPVIEPSRFPGQLIPCLKPRNRHGHLTTKPVDVCRHLIRLFAAPGGLVIDPFAGSGTTGVAVMAERLAETEGTAREFIGFEIDRNTALKADLRVEQAQRAATEGRSTTKI